MSFATRVLKTTCAAALTLGLFACGGGDDDDDAPSRGAVLSEPAQRYAFATAAELKTALGATATGAQLMALGGEPRCGVRTSSIGYATVGGKGEATSASAAVMVPQGADAACSGARPVLLYGHGTTFDSAFDMASPQNGEAGLLLALFASQGYVVVAPNYAGYAGSTLGYHPYLNAEQQSADMVDALRAARARFAALGARDSGQLFVSGYSQGGHVAMATVRAMQGAALAREFSVTASGPMSGPYAMADLLKTVFAGGVNLGAVGFTPMLLTSWQKAYGNLYATPADVYEAPYASGIETLLPGPTAFDQLLASGRLPPYLFSRGALVTGTPADAVFAAGVGTPALIKESFRQAAAADASHPLWAAAKRNDLLDFAPTRPMALCYGAGDPVVFASNSTQAASYFAGRGATLVTRMDVEDAATVGPAIAQGFAQAKQAVAADAAGSGANAAQRVLLAYHGALVPPFCAVAVRGFFQQVAGAGG